MTDDLIAYGRNALIAHGIVDSGDATTNGIGAMSDARWAEFLQSTTSEGLYPANLDVKQAYTLQFVNKKAGIELKK
jgi:NitT/TauT family transport system substrate-binding protein